MTQSGHCPIECMRDPLGPKSQLDRQQQLTRHAQAANDLR